ncbi:aminotransferase class III-fold pyridoxal phosphate-dependent enzyme [Glaciihabitans sp. INWT7]|uniref:aspartate aminotransferase family protein n=1 Tax=Glaciihabitans sp. INWT7 TaxID=2596912 RepID=UPI001623805E|nr:aminotransferase class III-fold pyridoxal phosphate-dependent enzyme [Glaciihabitans sp. INWT7]QNE46500.1 aminotransferase class III-fold pyridoxal phosphate-dependent enzyme [Glaciihabitans sp. INWT7]
MPGPSTYFSNDRLDELSEPTRLMVEQRNRSLGAAYRLFYDDPVEIVRGLGTKLWDAAGTEYLDVYNNVPSVGHSHPRVVDAVAAQAALVNTNTRYLDRHLVEYSEELLGTFPRALANVLYTCTGSEANDLALRIAKTVTGKRGVIVTRNAYHGVTSETALISPSLGGEESIASWVRLVDPPTGDGSTFADAVTAAAAELAASEHGFAALVADSIFASDGVQPGSAPFLGRVSDIVHDADGLYIADEVQSGFGRLGHHLWGFARHDSALGAVVPDLVTVGKPMGNGMPIGAVIARRELVDEFATRGRYFSTFGGTPVSIAAARAVLDILREDGLIENARVVGDYLTAGLGMLAGFHDSIGAVRGSGLFLGVDLVREGAPDENSTLVVVNELRRHGVLIGASGATRNTLKVRPPLCFSIADADRFLTELDSALRVARPARSI